MRRVCRRSAGICFLNLQGSRGSFQGTSPQAMSRRESSHSLGVKVGKGCQRQRSNMYRGQGMWVDV